MTDTPEPHTSTASIRAQRTSMRENGRRNARRARGMRRAMLGFDSPGRDVDVLTPDITFGAKPILHLLHGYSFCTLISVAALALVAMLPFGGEPITYRLSWLWIAPLIALSFGGIAWHITLIMQRHRVVRMQMGEQPDASVTVAAANMQWDILHNVFLHQHVASNVADALLYAGLLISEVVLFSRLYRGSDLEWKTAALPLAISGLLSLCVHIIYRLRFAAISFMISWYPCPSYQTSPVRDMLLPVVEFAARARNAPVLCTMPTPPAAPCMCIVVCID